jgi:hypothetical protein
MLLTMPAYASVEFGCRPGAPDQQADDWQLSCRGIIKQAALCQEPGRFPACLPAAAAAVTLNIQVRDFGAKLGGPGELTLNWKAPNNKVCIKEYVVTVKETGQRIVVPPKNDKQDGQLKFKAPAGKEGSSFTFTVVAFSNPGGKQGVSYSSNTLPTAAGRRRLLMLQQLVWSMVPGRH